MWGKGDIEGRRGRRIGAGWGRGAVRIGAISRGAFVRMVKRKQRVLEFHRAKCREAGLLMQKFLTLACLMAIVGAVGVGGAKVRAAHRGQRKFGLKSKIQMDVSAGRRREEVLQEKGVGGEDWLG